MQVSLGEEIVREDKSSWRVVRIADQLSLFEDSEGQKTVVKEHLLELKSEEGRIDFVVLAREENPYTGPRSKIKAPEPIRWGS